MKEVGTGDEDSPLLLLQWFMDMKQIKLLNVFSESAKDSKVSREEFKAGLKVRKYR